ncbi:MULTISPECIES: signal peptidase I [Bacillus cereus group]|uniref:Signal peptidase I n=1 Tax=Bacillus proteolyticus TaxID=2026192 RepID=A0ABV3II06_9BACI|nr:signal peptidase I [Bacillus cereus group sp. N8]MBJ8107855.1 signal peptidase I [Bacillus cereus group sp. N8]
MKQLKGKQELKWVLIILVVFIVIFIVRTFIFMPFKVDGESMEPTLQNKDRLFVNKVIIKFSPIKYGDIVVIKKTEDQMHLVKRVIGLAGDVVKITEGKLYINGVEKKEAYLNQDLLEQYKQLNYAEQKIPVNKVFVMGDNRLNSKDSRNGLGYIDESDIVGKTEFVYYPFNKIKFIN